MKQINCGNGRRSNSFRAAAAAALDFTNSAAEGSATTPAAVLKSPSAVLWAVLHGLCCIISLILGFRISRSLFFLLFSPAVLKATTTTTTVTTTTTTTTTTTVSIPIVSDPIATATTTREELMKNGSFATSESRVVVGRHGILIRPWPHPDPVEVMRAHTIMERVQREQRSMAAKGRESKAVLAVTPTHVRTFQAAHMTGLAHALALVPYEVTWVVVEAGGPTNETAAIAKRAGVPVIHVPFAAAMGVPAGWKERQRLESQMRLHALRIICERKLDAIVVFLDDSNVHSMEMFDEIQSVKWVGAMSIGILAHSGTATAEKKVASEEKVNLPIPVQGPACNSSGQLAGWHTFNSLPYEENSEKYVGEGATVLPQRLEWAGFVLNSRLLWKEAEGRPEWVRDLDSVGESGEEIDNPLALLKDASFVEPLGNCGKKVMLWWLRVEARADSKHPTGWIIDPPLDVTVPAKRTPWPDVPPELPTEKVAVEGHVEKHQSKTGRSSRSRHSSRKRKHDSRIVDTHASEMFETQAN